MDDDTRSRKGKDEGELSELVDHIDDQLSWMRSELTDLIGQIKRQPPTSRVHPGFEQGTHLGGEVSPFQQPTVHPGMPGAEPLMGPFGIPGAQSPTAPEAEASSPGQAGSGRDLRSMEPEIRQPVINVCDEGKELCIQAELPGVKKSDIDVEARTDRILLTARSALEDLSEGEVLFTERIPAEYRREIVLSEPIRPQDVQATLEDGVLTLRVGKATGSKGGQHVEIR